MYERTRARGFGAEVKRRIMLGTYALSSGYYDAYYGRAQKVRTQIAEDFAAAFERFDLLVTPTSPTVAFELGARTADPLAMYLSDYFTVPMSLAGIPAISIPAGLAAAAGGGPELPVGLQIAAPGVRRVGAARRRARARAARSGSRGRPARDDRPRSAARPRSRRSTRCPAWVRERLGEVAVIVEESHPDGPDGDLRPGRRACSGSSSSATRTRTPRRSARTVWHEIGHHFGMDEDADSTELRAMA